MLCKIHFYVQVSEKMKILMKRWRHVHLDAFGPSVDDEMSSSTASSPRKTVVTPRNGTTACRMSDTIKSYNNLVSPRNLNASTTDHSLGSSFQKVTSRRMMSPRSSVSSVTSPHMLSVNYIQQCQLVRKQRLHLARKYPGYRTQVSFSDIKFVNGNFQESVTAEKWARLNTVSLSEESTNERPVMLSVGSRPYELSREFLKFLDTLYAVCFGREEEDRDCLPLLKCNAEQIKNSELLSASHQALSSWQQRLAQSATSLNSETNISSRKSPMQSPTHTPALAQPRTLPVAASSRTHNVQSMKTSPTHVQSPRRSLAEVTKVTSRDDSMAKESTNLKSATPTITVKSTQKSVSASLSPQKPPVGSKFTGLFRSFSWSNLSKQAAELSITPILKKFGSQSTLKSQGRNVSFVLHSESAKIRPARLPRSRSVSTLASKASRGSCLHCRSYSWSDLPQLTHREKTKPLFSPVKTVGLPKVQPGTKYAELHKYVNWFILWTHRHQVGKTPGSSTVKPQIHIRLSADFIVHSLWLLENRHRMQRSPETGSCKLQQTLSAEEHSLTAPLQASEEETPSLSEGEVLIRSPAGKPQPYTPGFEHGVDPLEDTSLSEDGECDQTVAEEESDKEGVPPSLDTSSDDNETLSDPWKLPFIPPRKAATVMKSKQQNSESNWEGDQEHLQRHLPDISENTEPGTQNSHTLRDVNILSVANETDSEICHSDGLYTEPTSLVQNSVKTSSPIPPEILAPDDNNISRPISSSHNSESDKDIADGGGVESQDRHDHKLLTIYSATANKEVNGVGMKSGSHDNMSTALHNNSGSVGVETIGAVHPGSKPENRKPEIALEVGNNIAVQPTVKMISVCIQTSQLDGDTVAETSEQLPVSEAMVLQRSHRSVALQTDPELFALDKLQKTENSESDAMTISDLKSQTVSDGEYVIKHENPTNQKQHGLSSFPFLHLQFPTPQAPGIRKTYMHHFTEITQKESENCISDRKVIEELEIPLLHVPGITHHIQNEYPKSLSVFPDYFNKVRPDNEFVNLHSTSKSRVIYSPEKLMRLPVQKALQVRLLSMPKSVQSDFVYPHQFLKLPAKADLHLIPPNDIIAFEQNIRRKLVDDLRDTDELKTTKKPPKMLKVKLNAWEPRDERTKKARVKRRRKPEKEKPAPDSVRETVPVEKPLDDGYVIPLGRLDKTLAAAKNMDELRALPSYAATQYKVAVELMQPARGTAATMTDDLDRKPLKKYKDQSTETTIVLKDAETKYEEQEREEEANLIVTPFVPTLPPDVMLSLNFQHDTRHFPIDQNTQKRQFLNVVDIDAVTMEEISKTLPETAFGSRSAEWKKQRETRSITMTSQKKIRERKVTTREKPGVRAEEKVGVMPEEKQGVLAEEGDLITEKEIDKSDEEVVGIQVEEEEAEVSAGEEVSIQAEKEVCIQAGEEVGIPAWEEVGTPAWEEIGIPAEEKPVPSIQEEASESAKEDQQHILREKTALESFRGAEQWTARMLMEGKSQEGRYNL